MRQAAVCKQCCLLLYDLGQVVADVDLSMDSFANALAPVNLLRILASNVLCSPLCQTGQPMLPVLIGKERDPMVTLFIHVMALSSDFQTVV